MTRWMLYLAIQVMAALALDALIANSVAAPAECGRGRGQSEIASCSEVIRINPRAWWAYVNRGVSWDAMGQFDRAIADYSEAIKLNPKSALAYTNRGKVWDQKGDLDRALADHNRALLLNPKDDTAYSNRGSLYNAKGDFDRAIVDYNNAIKFNPRSAVAFTNRGIAKHNKGEFSNAIEDFKTALRLDPKFQRAKEEMRIAQDSISSNLSPQVAFGKPAEPSRPQQTEDKPLRPSYGKRVALVIGNAKYTHAGMLQNPIKDAQLLAATLRSSGFQSVTTKTDLTREGIIQALREFSKVADTADWAVIYFSGHGIEFGGVSYIIPVDAQLYADKDIELETISIRQLLNTVDGAKRLRLLILDACRNNPFAGQMRRTMASRSIGQGLAGVEPEAGTLVIYAAKHGETALDGKDNSPFVQALTRRVQQKPDLEVRRLFDFVRDDVLASTGRRQQPFSYGSLSASEDFYFAN